MKPAGRYYYVGDVELSDPRHYAEASLKLCFDGKHRTHMGCDPRHYAEASLKRLGGVRVAHVRVSLKRLTPEQIEPALLVILGITPRPH